MMNIEMQDELLGNITVMFCQKPSQTERHVKQQQANSRVVQSTAYQFMTGSISWFKLSMLDRDPALACVAKIKPREKLLCLTAFVLHTSSLVRCTLHVLLGEALKLLTLHCRITLKPQW